MAEGKVRIDPRDNDVSIELERRPTNKGGKGPMFEEAVNLSNLGPHFDKDAPEYIAATVGSPAHIPCKARNLGSRSVSIYFL